jgi:hypothetical protein
MLRPHQVGFDLTPTLLLFSGCVLMLAGPSVLQSARGLDLVAARGRAMPHHRDGQLISHWIVRKMSIELSVS